MSVRALRSSDPIGDGRDGPVVVVLAGDTIAALVPTLQAVLANTEARTPVVVACADELADELALVEVERDVALLALSAPVDAAAALEAVHRRTGGCDLALVAAGVLVGPGWLEGLRDAAHADSIVMTASPLAMAARDARELEALAGSIRRASAHVHPSIARLRGDCCYLRAEALALVGAPAPDEDHGLDAFSARVSALGLVHVLADDVTVRADEDAALLASDAGALARAVAVAATAVRPLHVTVDARGLDSGATAGTRTYMLDLLIALAREEAVRLRVVLSSEPDPEILAPLQAAGDVEAISYRQALEGVALSDVVHRPQQVFTVGDLNLLRLLGERIVITHHDLIAYRSGAYHATAETWQDYRRVTRLSLAAADMVIFPSRHAREDALRDDLIAPARAHAVPDGAERLWPAPPAAALRPPGIAEGERLLVCIGADYAHKNRPFAIALASALRERHGWDGRLVLAGAHAEHGSSRPQEQAMLAADPALAAQVSDLGPVDDAARAWLYTHADAVVYPSVYEGFGLVPFEAAQAGVPCLYAAVGALAELAAPELAPLVAWDARASADAVAALLEPGEPRSAQVGGLLAAAQASSWANAVPLLREVYHQAVRSPHRASAPRVAEELEREAHIVALAASAEHDRERAAELASANHEAHLALGEAHGQLGTLRASVGGFAERAEGGFLTADQRRGLLRVASRPLLRRLLFAPFALGGRVRGAAGAEGPSDLS